MSNSSRIIQVNPTKVFQMYFRRKKKRVKALELCTNYE